MTETHLDEVILPNDAVTLASERVKLQLDTAYDEGKRMGELLQASPLEDPRLALRQEEAGLITQNGSLVTRLETSRLRGTVNCEECGWVEGQALFNLNHYQIGEGAIVGYDPEKGFIATGGELKVRRVRGISVETLHRLRELHSPSSEAVKQINDLFD